VNVQRQQSNNKEEFMARWQPRSPLENLQSSLQRVITRIEGKKEEVKELEEQKKQVEQAIAALNKK
jgi:predicted  nucleic acid-binding Zn-ribbon protein